MTKVLPLKNLNKLAQTDKLKSKKIVNQTENLAKKVKKNIDSKIKESFLDFEERGYFISEGKIYSIIFPR